MHLVALFFRLASCCHASVGHSRGSPPVPFLPFIEGAIHRPAVKARRLWTPFSLGSVASHLTASWGTPTSMAVQLVVPRCHHWSCQAARSPKKAQSLHPRISVAIASWYPRSRIYSTGSQLVLENSMLGPPSWQAALEACHGCRVVWWQSTALALHIP